MDKIYQKTGNIGVSRLTIMDLEDIASGCLIDGTDTRHNGITINQPSVEIKIDGPDELEQHEDSLTYTNAIAIASFSRQSTTKEEVFVAISRTGIRVGVSGSDERWVLGSYDKIVNLLKTKQAAWLYRLTRLMFLPLTVFAFAATFLLIPSVIYSHYRVYYLLNDIIFLAVSAFGFGNLGRFISGELLPHT